MPRHCLVAKARFNISFKEEINSLVYVLYYPAIHPQTTCSTYLRHRDQ